MKTNQNKPSLHSDDFLVIRLIPNVFTTIGMCVGLTGIRYAVESDWKSAVTCVLIAAFFDLIDGLTARILKATSKMGQELDSLSDAVSFGVTPTVILYLWTLSLNNLETEYVVGWYWIPFIFYSSCCVLRLARFNINNKDSNEILKKHISYFVGVPSPAGAIILLAPVIIVINFNRFGISGVEYMHPSYVCIWVMIVSLLMVSRIPTLSLKSIKYKISYKKVTFVLIGVILLAAIIIREQWVSLAILIFVYLASIPVYACYLYKKK